MINSRVHTLKRRTRVGRLPRAETLSCRELGRGIYFEAYESKMFMSATRRIGNYEFVS